VRILVGRPEGKWSLGKSRRLLEDNINMYLRGHGVWFIWLKVGLLWTQQWTFGIHKRRGISWLAEWPLASQEGICCMLCCCYVSLGRCMRRVQEAGTPLGNVFRRSVSPCSLRINVSTRATKRIQRRRGTLSTSCSDKATPNALFPCCVIWWKAADTCFKVRVIGPGVYVSLGKGYAIMTA
jgi:hypothetical protein